MLTWRARVPIAEVANVAPVLAFFARGSLFGRPALGRRDVARVWGDVRPFSFQGPTRHPGSARKGPLGPPRPNLRPGSVGNRYRLSPGVTSQAPDQARG